MLLVQRRIQRSRRLERDEIVQTIPWNPSAVGLKAWLLVGQQVLRSKRLGGLRPGLDAQNCRQSIQANCQQGAPPLEAERLA